MSDLIEFLAARLDEDEAAAKAWLPFGNPTDAQREHLARHDPARVLREVEAKREIINYYRSLAPGYPTPEALRWALLVLAAAYRDHPDYQEPS